MGIMIIDINSVFRVLPAIRLLGELLLFKYIIY